MTFKIGDRVRLTGSSWRHFLEHGTIPEDIVTIAGLDNGGDPYFEGPDGYRSWIYARGGVDYSAELVTDEWIPAFTEVEETVKVKKAADKPEIVPGDVLVVKTDTGELINYFAVAGHFNPVNLYSANGYIANWDTILESAESYRFLFKDGKVV